MFVVRGNAVNYSTFPRWQNRLAAGRDSPSAAPPPFRRERQSPGTRATTCKAWVGQQCAHAPHPVQAAASTAGRRTAAPSAAFSSTTLTAPYAQCFSQSAHGWRSLRARQSDSQPETRTARPIFVLAFSSRESFRIAPVGHTSPQSVHAFSHDPRVKSITGIMTPARPYSSVAARRTFVGHFATHSPHPVQRPRSRAPPSVPGGATAADGTRASARPPPAAAHVPAIAPSRNPLRLTSMTAPPSCTRRGNRSSGRIGSGQPSPSSRRCIPPCRPAHTSRTSRTSPRRGGCGRPS